MEENRKARFISNVVLQYLDHSGKDLKVSEHNQLLDYVDSNTVKSCDPDRP
jgi:hypothetical protein